MFRACMKLTKVGLLRYMGINQVFHSGSGKKKRRLVLVFAIFLFFDLMIAFFSTLLSWTFCWLGAPQVVVPFMLMGASVIIFFFAMFKSGAVLFGAKDYEMLISLPIPSGAIVASRFLSMYFGELVLTVLMVVPATVVYGIFEGPGIAFYLLVAFSIPFMPLVPLVAASVVGVVFTALGARFKKRKNLITAIFSLAFLIGYMILYYSFIFSGREVTSQQVTQLAAAATQEMNRIYPLANLYQLGISEGNWVAYMGFLCISAGVFMGFVVLVQWRYVAISNAIFAQWTRKKAYRLGQLRQKSVLKALYVKEVRKYLASSIYLTNTAMGYVMMIGGSVALAFLGRGQLAPLMEAGGKLGAVLPVFLAALGLLSTTTPSSISLEGKQWWISQSLPIGANPLFLSKMLLNLTLAIPSSILSAAILVATGTTGGGRPVWLFVMPVAYALFGSVMGITVNRKFPSLDWDNEAQVVKRGMSAFVAMVVELVSAGIPLVLLLACPVWGADWILAGTLVVLAAAALVLHEGNRRCDLRKIQ